MQTVPSYFRPAAGMFASFGVSSLTVRLSFWLLFLAGLSWWLLNAWPSTRPIQHPTFGHFPWNWIGMVENVVPVLKEGLANPWFKRLNCGSSIENEHRRGRFVI